MARASIEDPLKVFRFRVVIQGFVRAGFTEVSGLSRETDIAEYREGNMPTTPQKSSGISKFGDLTFKRGQVVGAANGGDSDFADWAAEVYDPASNAEANLYRRDIEIEQFNALNQKVRVWRVSNAWPKSFKPMSDLNGTSSENSIEELVLAHEGFEQVL